MLCPAADSVAGAAAGVLSAVMLSTLQLRGWTVSLKAGSPLHSVNLLCCFLFLCGAAHAGCMDCSSAPCAPVCIEQEQKHSPVCSGVQRAEAQPAIQRQAPTRHAERQWHIPNAGLGMYGGAAPYLTFKHDGCSQKPPASPVQVFTFGEKSHGICSGGFANGQWPDLTLK
jgi:hypothetical protein